MTLAASPYLNNRGAFVDGLEIEVASNTTLVLDAGSCSDSTSQINMVLTESITLDAATNGLNGLDTGSLQASKVYYVYLISDYSSVNPVGCLLSLSLTAPVMPDLPNTSGTYPIIRRIGWAVTDGSSHFKTLHMSGNGSQKVYTYDTPVAALSAGAATTQTAVTLTAYVPAIDNQIVNYSALLVPATATNVLTLYPSGSTGTSQTILAGQVNSVAVRGQFAVPTKLISGVPKIDYKVTNGSDAATLYVYSIVDNL